MSHTADFLLELLSEEIPARMQARARRDLARMFAEALAAAGLGHGQVTTFSTPRRLALIVAGLPLATEAVSEEIKGPRRSAPPQAVEGFLRKTGLSQDQLEERDGVWFARIDKPGRATTEVLAETVAQIARDFPWPKSMRWGAASSSSASLRWVRPLHSIVALLGEEIVPVAIDGVTCGAATLGHRFHHPGVITIGGAHDYVEKLRACHVIVDHTEREAIVGAGAIAAAENAGFNLVEDEGLVVENAGLTEWPVPLLGSFDPDFLDVPPEVITLSARTNQKYFVMRDREGKLAPHFVCTANIDANDGGKSIIAGNERVLAARLSDARFFWQQDLNIALEEQAKKLEQIVFHEKLGTVADKVERVAKLAEWLVNEGIVKGCSAADARRAALLCKADLVTGMVGEFPELQGVIGGYLARAQGENGAIADAIRDHYKPAGQGDEVPTAPVTVAVSLADKLDTVISFYAIGETPTGSKDPFAVRRAALAIIRLIIENDLRIFLLDVGESHSELVQKDSQNFRMAQDRLRARQAGVSMGFSGYATLKAIKAREVRGSKFGSISWDTLEFFADRLKVQQREAGVRHDLIDAVFTLGGEDDLVRLLSRVKALQAFVETGEGANLLAGYKRASNILKKEGWSSAPAEAGALAGDTPTDPPLRPSPEHALEATEAALIGALNEAEPRAAAAIEVEDFTGAMTALASLRAPIDAFFDAVTVNDPDTTVRTRRLILLARFRDAVHRVANFSKIEG
ncbi:MAG: glycine--tRNA ligase subunit beta [Pseudomonadota bacterium]|nr:glycine--tRNA ligase subunit beta [Pseudomonadota bacterium]